MAQKLDVLIVEDSIADYVLLVQLLEDAEFVVEHTRVDSAAGLVAALDSRAWDLVISDYHVPGFSGTAALALVRARTLDLPFIFVSGMMGEDLAVAAMVAGANDYVMKHSLKRLVPAIERELREAERRREQLRVEQALERSEARFSRLFRSSPVAIALLSRDLDRILDANPACAKATGRSLAVLRTRHQFAELLAPQDLARIRDLLDREGGARNLTLEVRGPDGEPATMMVTLERLALDTEEGVLLLLHTPGSAAWPRSRAA